MAVVIEVDDAPREVKTPADLSAALAADPESERRRKEHIRWIEKAKRGNPPQSHREMRYDILMIADCNGTFEWMPAVIR